MTRSEPAQGLAYWTVEAGRGELRAETLPPCAAGEVRVQAICSAVSRGTELIVHRGRVPPSEYERMRAPFQCGVFPFPVKYGYCSVGRVVEGPAPLLGTIVFCLHPHQNAYVVPASAVVPVPDEVPPRRAILAGNMETALNGLWDAELKAGDRVSVVGAGVVGCLVAYLAARHPGTEVELVDVDARKAEIAHAMGASFAAPEAARRDADVVVHASGQGPGLETALGLAAMEATVLELSWYGNAQVSLSLGAAFHPLRLRLRSSQVGGLPLAQRARWTHRRRLELALRLLADERLEQLIDSHAPFERLPQVFEQLSAGALGALCHRVDYRQEP